MSLRGLQAVAFGAAVTLVAMGLALDYARLVGPLEAGADRRRG